VEPYSYSYPPWGGRAESVRTLSERHAAEGRHSTRAVGRRLVRCPAALLLRVGPRRLPHRRCGLSHTICSAFFSLRSAALPHAAPPCQPRSPDTRFIGCRALSHGASMPPQAPQDGPCRPPRPPRTPSRLGKRARRASRNQVRAGSSPWRGPSSQEQQPAGREERAYPPLPSSSDPSCCRAGPQAPAWSEHEPIGTSGPRAVRGLRGVTRVAVA